MENKTLNIKIHGVELIEKLIYKTQIKEGDVLNFEVTTQSSTDIANSLIVIFIEVVIKRADDQNAQVATMMIGCGFYVENFESSLEKNDKGEIIIPADLENWLKGLSISTMRGIMFSELRGTQLDKAILPIIMVDTLVPTEKKLI